LLFDFLFIQKVASQFVVEVKNRKKDLEHFNLLASQLQHRNALCGQEMTLNLINGDWDQIMQGVKGLITTQNGNGLETRASGDGGGSKLFTAPGSPLMRSAPMEVATRMAKMMDAVAAIDRQLDTQTLGTERPCENLAAQSEALSTVKNALDRLRPTLKQTDQDLDRLSSANLSMEYFEQLSNSNSKLHKEWDRVRYRYAQRQELWSGSKKLETDLMLRKEQIEVWLRSIRNDSANINVTNEDIENKGKLAAELTTFCKAFMTKTSAQEAVAVQAEVDSLLRRWRSILAVLTKERKAAFGLCEKVDSMSLTISKAVNASHIAALEAAITELTELHGGINGLRSQLCQRINDEGMRDPALLKARTTVERLAVNLPRRIEALKEKEQRLRGLKEKRGMIMSQIEDISDQVKRSKASGHDQQVMFKSAQLAIANLQYEVNRVLNDFACLEREVANHQMEMDADTSTEMLALKSAWLNLSADVRHLATGFIDSKRHLDFGSASDTATTANPSLTSPQSTYSITNESCVSPTTCSQSSFLSDESQVDFDDLAARIEKELQQILEEATQLDLAVDDPVAIRAVVDHQQQVI
jgi:hypothetical protein